MHNLANLREVLVESNSFDFIQLPKGKTKYTSDAIEKSDKNITIKIYSD